ncbi:TPA: hypothetical protein DCE37_10565 [Candidatus Latescibacteria bacterium]|nr:hypothetical protein [Candidatus Latescibacterota bacterium]|tara:strand:- start:30 stop:461 length:432 start_codon:yes stop_codon:yes gene_type:complete
MRCLKPAILVAALMCSTTVWSLENTEANRLAQANRYLEATTPAEMVADMAQNMSKNLPENRRQEFIDIMTKNLDLVSLRKTMVDAMVKHFTAEDLKALADFYGSPIGKSAMKKYGGYMADVMPKLQQDVMRAFSEFMQSATGK